MNNKKYKKCAFDCGEDCRALNAKECERCSFYKTEEELREGRERATAKVLMLDPQFKEYIRYKYYGGRGRYGL